MLHINLGFIKFGTDDKFQGAAILISIFLVALCIAALLSSLHDGLQPVCDKIIGWAQPILLVVIGAAIGKSASR